jgi:predicted amino acid-binding ACT domain protein
MIDMIVVACECFNKQLWGQVIYLDPDGTKGFSNPRVDIRVEIEDKPGVLADVTSILAGEAINIKDIAILKIRENLGGVLQLLFEDKKTARKAAELLQAKGYHTYGDIPPQVSSNTNKNSISPKSNKQ